MSTLIHNIESSVYQNMLNNMMLHLDEPLARTVIGDYRGQGFSTFDLLDMIWCPPGTFFMGSPTTEPGRWNDEELHEVELTDDFFIGRTPVTQKVWETVMGNNPAYYKGDDNPIESVSWNDCQEFIKKLNEMYPAPAGYEWALPTEAQWEYACRAGTQTAFSFGDDASELGKYAWYADNSNWTTHPVGLLLPNPWGLYDVHGNVWEWCQDWYGPYSEQVSDTGEEVPQQVTA